MALPLLIVASPLINFSYGVSFSGSVAPFQFLLVGVIFSSASFAIRPHILINFAKPFVISIAGIFSLVIDGVLNYIFISHWGIGGAGAATMITYGIYSMILLLYFARKSRFCLSDILFIKGDDFRLLRGKIQEWRR